MKNVAIIPARGGSKRIIGKNTRLFHNKPIISWVINLAQESDCFEKIIISTDCEKTAELGKSLGADVPFLRPESISDDYTSVIEVIRHAIEFFQSKGEFYELATLIYPTSPLMNVADLKKAVEFIGEYDFSLSVALFPYPIQFDREFFLFHLIYLFLICQNLPHDSSQKKYHNRIHYY